MIAHDLVEAETLAECEAKTAAFHEAGHVWIAYLRGLSPGAATIGPGPRGEFKADLDYAAESRGGYARSRFALEMLVSGAVAEVRVKRGYQLVPALWADLAMDLLRRQQWDLELAEPCLKALQARGVSDPLRAAVEAVVADLGLPGAWQAVADLAAVLESKRSLSAVEVAQAIGRPSWAAPRRGA
jgi:hypothetical protein